jgi:hypothetical protein
MINDSLSKLFGVIIVLQEQIYLDGEFTAGPIDIFAASKIDQRKRKAW